MAQLNDLLVTGDAKVLGKIQGIVTKAEQDGNGNTITSTYLPLSGGTISRSEPTTSILTLNNTGSSNSWVYFSSSGTNKASVGYYDNFASLANETNLARIGVANDGTPQYRTGTAASTAKTLIHSGNIGSQSVASAETASNLSGFVNSNSSSPVALDNATTNGHYYTSGCPSIFSQNDGALYVQAYNSTWVGQIFQDYRTGQLGVRGKNNGTWQSWRKVLDSTNYTDYAPTKTGSGASGTWGISVTGSSASCTGKAAKADKIVDAGNGNDITINYSSIDIKNPVWLAAWNGYTLGPTKLSELTVGNATTAGAVAWDNVTGKPGTFPPSSHTHALADVGITYGTSDLTAGSSALATGTLYFVYE